MLWIIFCVLGKLKAKKLSFSRRVRRLWGSGIYRLQYIYFNRKINKMHKEARSLFHERTKNILKMQGYILPIGGLYFRAHSHSSSSSHTDHCPRCWLYRLQCIWQNFYRKYRSIYLDIIMKFRVYFPDNSVSLHNNWIKSGRIGIYRSTCGIS